MKEVPASTSGPQLLYLRGIAFGESNRGPRLLPLIRFILEEDEDLIAIYFGEYHPLSQPQSCVAKTARGMPCNAHPTQGSDYCFFHDPQKAIEHKQATSEGGKNSQSLPLRDVETLRLRTNEDVLAAIETVVNEVRRNEISPKAANSVAYLLNVRLSALPVVQEPASDSPPDRVREMLIQLAENSIAKARIYNLPLPDDLKAIAAAKEESNRNCLEASDQSIEVIPNVNSPGRLPA